MVPLTIRKHQLTQHNKPIIRKLFPGQRRFPAKRPTKARQCKLMTWLGILLEAFKCFSSALCTVQTVNVKLLIREGKTNKIPRSGEIVHIPLCSELWAPNASSLATDLKEQFKTLNWNADVDVYRTYLNKKKHYANWLWCSVTIRDIMQCLRSI